MARRSEPRVDVELAIRRLDRQLAEIESRSRQRALGRVSNATPPDFGHGTAFPGGILAVEYGSPTPILRRHQ